EGYSYDRRTAHALYRQLVVPVAPVLEGKRHVFIAAAGSLTGIPFAILVTEEPQGADDDAQALRTTRWFADAHALINIPSIQSLEFLRRFGGTPRPSGDSSASFVGFGDPVLHGQAIVRGRGVANVSPAFYKRQTRSASGLADISQIRQLARLPGTAVELENMRSALRSPTTSLFLAGRATEHALRAMDLSGTRVLALATHGLVAGEVMGSSEPGLIFTPPDIATDQDDGFLAASEVSALRLDADWVILSACNTAAGDGSAGAPGLSGLARAFFYAGARNLLASHWLVVDEAAPRLTVRTIELMRENPALSRAEALQRSMREIRDDRSRSAWAHPGVWAPFSLIGDAAR
ncbi:MAG: CHAT domain-containing protein, partial [Novosphingobium sp.]|nr:CHAT domain-containing protein [Novosphingobium sp.]